MTRLGGKEDIILTMNEVFCSRNEPEKFRVATVGVGEHDPRPPRYPVGHDFGKPIFDQTAAVFGLRKLLQQAGDAA